jgi:hypothetical protein
MDPLYIVLLFILALLLLGFLQVVVLFALMRLLRTKPAAQELFDHTKAKSYDILHKAVQESQSMMTEAELKGLEMVSKGKLEGQQATKAFQEHLGEAESTLSKELDASVQQSQGAFEAFLKQSQAKVSEQIANNEQLIGEQSAQMVKQTQQLLEEFTGQVQTQVKAQIETEWQSVRVEVEEYKKLRMRIIDERITEIIEDVVRVALDKKFSFADHSDLLFKALEEAKHNNGFVSAAPNQDKPEGA